MDTDTETLTPDETDTREALLRSADGPAWLLRMDPKDAVTVYQALKTHLLLLAQQPDPPVDTLATVVELLRVVRPSAIEASVILQGKVNMTGD